VLGIALTNMGEVVSFGKACFAPPNAIAYADAMAGHRFAMLARDCSCNTGIRYIPVGQKWRRCRAAE
jgi:hypothetical protein